MKARASVRAGVLAVLVLAAALASCGKRSQIEPPPGEPVTYPKVYPAPNDGDDAPAKH